MQSFPMRTVLIALAILFCVAATGRAQKLTSVRLVEEFFERQTFNEGFEQGLAEWQFKYGTSQGITVEAWSSLPDDEPQPSAPPEKFLSDPDDGRRGQVVKISGINGIWQYAPVTGAARYQVACCNARKRIIPGRTADLGWAGFGVIYYDAAWQEIARIEQQIFEFKPDPFFDSPTGYSQYSVGTAIPDNAFHSILWLANDSADSELWADDLVLLNEFIGVPLQDRTKPQGSRLKQNPVETNLIANSHFKGIISFDNNDVNDPLDVPGRFLLSNSEFNWEGAGDLRRGLLVDQAAYWQVVDLKANQTYDLTIAYRNTGVAVAGVDFYDENWNFIGKESEPLDGIINVDINGFEAAQETRRFKVPAGAKYSTVFIWQAPGQPSQLQVVQTALRPVPPTARAKRALAGGR